VDAYLELRGGDRTAWKGEVSTSSVVRVDAPSLWGGDKDQGGIVGNLHIMMGEPTQAPNPLLAAIFGDQQPAWRGLATLAYHGLYGSMSPYPQKASHKLRKIKEGWSEPGCWYPEKAAITMKIPPSAALYFALDLSGSMGTVATNGKSRLGNMKAAIAAVLDQVGEAVGSGSAIDIMLVGFGDRPDSRVSIARSAATLADIAALKSWVASRNANYGTYFTAGVMDMPEFFGSSSASTRLAFFVTDGVPSASPMTPQQIADEAGAVVQSVHVKCYGINIDLADTQYTEHVNTSGEPVMVVSGGEPEQLTGVIRSAIFGGLFGINPAHALYYARTETEIGRVPRARMNDASYRAAADKLYAEGFGICTSYDPAAESLEEFELRIGKLIGGSVSTSLADGQYYIDLARGDYDIDTLPIITDDDILSFSAQSSLMTGTVNSVAVKYFDPDRKESITTPPAQALGLIDSFGVIQQINEYPEIPTASLALRVALRDLLATTSPTRTMEMTLIPDAVRDIRPNQPFRLQSFKRRIGDMVCIVGSKESGTLKSGGVKVLATQDTYSLPSTSYVEVEQGPVGGSNAPKPISVQLAVEVPYVALMGYLSNAELGALLSGICYVGAAAADPGGMRNFVMMTSVDGAGYTDGNAVGDWCATTVISESAGRMATTVAAASPAAGQVGGLALWGTELVQVTGIDIVAGTITVGRGVADTVPQVHESNERLWFLDEVAVAREDFGDGETVSVKLLPSTGAQVLGVEDAAAMSVVLGGRIDRPYPPARCAVAGVFYPDSRINVTGDVTVTWATRDRDLQADQLLDSMKASVAPHRLTRFSLRVFGEAGELVVSRSDIAGTSATVRLTASGLYRIELSALNDYGPSLQHFDAELNVELAAGAPVPAAPEIVAATWTRPQTIIDGGEVTA